MVVKIIKPKKACTLLVKSAVFEQQLHLFSDGFHLPTGDMKVSFKSLSRMRLLFKSYEERQLKLIVWCVGPVVIMK